MEYEYILETEHIRKKFGDLQVLKDINLKVKKGEVICIIGPSGAGNRRGGFGAIAIPKKAESGKLKLL